MQVVSTGMTVADYCKAMERNELVVNREYQRSAKVWPDTARSFLIETIFLGYPIPKLSLFQVTDLKSKKSYKEIVDGQQRSAAIFDFCSNNLRLSRTLESDGIAGRTYEELEDPDKQRILDYPISLDLFTGTTPEEVREVFRRMNSYTVPLNPEEHRHASYQGLFKWFVNRVARQFDDSFITMGVFTSQQVVRMADTKLISEVCHAFLNGITTTNKTALDNLFKSNDKEFAAEDELTSRLRSACDQLIEWNDLHQGPLMKPHIAYALLLAVSHMRQPAERLQSVFESAALASFNRTAVIENLSSLAEALENPEETEWREFVAACAAGGTNVKAKREDRFRWMCKALLPESL